jgi:hypothetical protein
VSELRNMLTRLERSQQTLIYLTRISIEENRLSRLEFERFHLLDMAHSLERQLADALAHPDDPATQSRSGPEAGIRLNEARRRIQDLDALIHAARERIAHLEDKAGE